MKCLIRNGLLMMTDDPSVKRKFARGRGAVGSAAAIRVAVVKDLREISSLNKQKLVKPIDYENYIIKNRTLLHHDSLPELLLFPHDDISQSELPRRLRTVHSSVPPNAFNEAQQLLARESIKFYTSKWNVIHFKYVAYSNGFQDLPKFGTSVELHHQIFEIDLEPDSKEEESALKSHLTTVTYKGWLFKGPDSPNESIVSFSRSFKRRFCYLKQQADASYVLEFHKDEKRTELKGSVFLDLAVDVSKSIRKGKLSFEIQTQDKEAKAFHLFAAESESDLEEWISALKKVIQSNDGGLLKLRDKGVDPACRGDGLRKSFEQSINPELQKHARETDHLLAQQRREGRRKIFLLYPEIKKNLPSERKAEDFDHESDLYREHFGTRFVVHCDSFRLRLQANLADEGQPERLDNPEPFFLTFSLYDAGKGKKISEDFHFNPNSLEIRQMIPNDVYKPVSNGTSPGGATSSPEFSSYLPDPKWLEAQKMAIFSVTQPKADVFLVVRIEKVLQGSISAALDNYLRTTDQKTGTKVHKAMKQCCQRLGRYRMPFVWAARPLFRKYSVELDLTADFVVYKAECSRVCDEEIIRQLQDMRRTDKQMRFQPIHGVVLTVNVSPFKIPALPCILTPTLLAVRPSDDPNKNTPTREVEEFVPEDGTLSNPYTTYVNHLYFHPKNLKFDAYKASKARNIACNVEVRDSDEEGSPPLKVIYGPLGSSLFVSSSLTTVLHHNTSPDFMDEVKISLPTHLHGRHHLVFTFYHIACDLTAKPSSKKGVSTETVVGYAWFPLLLSGRVNVGEHTIRVASNLPSGYLGFESLGLGKGSIGPDVRWVDGGRPLFRFGLLLMSTIYTKDPHLHNFFTHCQKLENLPSVSADVGSVNKIKSLHAVDVSALINFLPSLLTQLFRLLTRTNSEDVAVNIVKVLIHVVSTAVHSAKKTALLNSYVKYVFVTETVAGEKPKTVHEELAQHLKTTLRPNNTDQVVIGKFLKHSWFFFEVLIKSMAQHLLVTERIKMARNERFPSSFQFHIEVLVQSLCRHIVQKYKESADETKIANISLAQFIKKCFTLMDRGFVFNLINYYMEQFSPCDVKVLSEMKFEFLRVVCNHEHFIPLNLPLMKQVKSYKEVRLEDVKHDYTLSEEYQQNHFLVGLLLFEVKSVLNEIHDIRKFAIKVLRNILAKHSLDDRYSSKASQARISALYLPLLTIVLENKNRLCIKESVHSSPSNLLNGDTPSMDGSNRMGSLDSYSSQMSLDQTSLSSASSAGSSVSQPRPARDPVFSLISGPVLNTQSLLEQQRQSHYGSTSSLASTVSANSTTTVERLSDNMSQKEGREKCESMISMPCSSVVSTVVTRYDKLTQEEIKDLLICFLYIVNNLAEEVLLGWFNNSPEYDILDFLGVLEICIQLFRYPGRHLIKTFRFIGDSSRRSATMPVAPLQRMAPSLSGLRTSSVFSDLKIEGTGGGGGGGGGGQVTDCNQQILLDANISVETGMIVLDIISVYSEKFKEQLQYQNGENAVMHKIFELYMTLIQTNQSEAVQKHAFASLRLFIGKFPRVLFQGQVNLCGRLCYEVLRCCSSRLDSTRSEACPLIYLLMRKNYEFSKCLSFNRVHVQVIISISQLISNSAIISNSRFAESLSIICSYASSETGLQRSSFPIEVKELTKCVRTVLMATAALKEHEKNPEMFVDLQYSLAKSYTSNPELRKTWLESMAQIHVKNGDFSEAAHCYIHIAALIAEYLKRRGEFPKGCTVFNAISTNVESEESGMRDDSGMELEVVYREDDLITHLETSATLLQKAERYELLGEIYRFILPIYEEKRDFQKLAEAYGLLQVAYSKIVEVMKSGKRLLGKYFRVAFHGQSFSEEGGKQYIYKEPKITGLTEICDRLLNLYSSKYGQGNVQLLMDSNKVNPQDLDPKIAYLQVTYVNPYFDEAELLQRQTHFERSNNIRRFMFETPFTAGGKAHGLIEEQQKRKTILTASHSFPYVKKRIQVVYHKEEVLSPIEVAIDEMKNKVAEMNEVVEEHDIKKLQLKLQGCVSVQVNAGPLAYAEAFLVDGKIQKYKRDKVGALKEYFRGFVQVCKEALSLNSQLIHDDQRDYQESLRKNFESMARRLGEIFGEALLEPDDSGCSVTSNRNSLIIQGSISTTGSVMTF